jgi:hypothetical protein
VAGQFVSRVFVVLLRKRFPQNHNLQTAAVLSVTRGNMKILASILFYLFSLASEASQIICHENRNESINLSLKEAETIGFTYTAYEKEKVNNTYCRIIHIISLGKMQNKNFSGINLLLESSTSLIGQFSISPLKYENNEHYGAAFEVCEGNVKTVKTTFIFGEVCSLTSYIIEVKPWSL